jgi:wyosine [tRNA(Phe)-imidazoG37] synthetase (radical SAM superfamily)
VNVLTFSGSGEPTLHTGLDEFIRTIKADFSLPVTVLTNGALLSRSTVRNELRDADIVLPSMDAWSERTFRRINRPHPGIRLNAVLTGLETFRRSFQGQIWLEILFVRGINDGDRDLSRLFHQVERIQPDKIQLNTVMRPPAESWVRPLSRQRLEEIRSALGSRAEIIVPFRGEVEIGRLKGMEKQVVEMVNRRPVSREDLVDILGIGPEEAMGVLGKLAELYGWVRMSHGGRLYFRNAFSETKGGRVEPEDLR